jgi:hypothetical protein
MDRIKRRDRKAYSEIGRVGPKKTAGEGTIYEQPIG